MAKAKQKNLNKVTSVKQVEWQNKRWSHNIATIKPPTKSNLVVAQPN
jgi:hypothetical protein